MAHDPHDDLTVEALVAVALGGNPEGSEGWAAIYALQRRGGEAVLVAASALLHSRDPKARARGADILAQLEQPHDVRSRGADLLLALLREEQDAQVLQSLVLGLGHREDARVPGAISALKDHASARVRGAVLAGLLKAPDADTLPVLLAFAEDPDEGVRSLAMAHLRELSPDVDTPALRDLLLRRMEDTSPTIRAEAVLALACRKDARVLEPLRKALRRSRVRLEYVEAAGALGDASVLPALRALVGQREEDPPFTRALVEALAALEAEA
ncbi:HEAT repeat domain-containing protein [Corallococcus llansteffanensis]|nr:HEAT repeat domain-containing protein [Corallococcus llansteffanensis]